LFVHLILTTSSQHLISSNIIASESRGSEALEFEDAHEDQLVTLSGKPKSYKGKSFA